MSLGAWVTLAVLAAVIALAVSDLADPTVALGGGVGVLLLAGVLSPERALDGLANPAVAVIGLLFVLVAAVERTSWLARLAELGFGTGGRRAGARGLGAVAFISAFVSNATVVAVLMPAVREWCRRRNIDPSRLMMPVGFAATLGGMLTVIGTSSNLVLDGLLLGRGDRGLGFFELAAVGLPVAALGVLYLALYGPRLLPGRPDPLAEIGADPREYVGWLRVVPGGELDGATVADLRSLENLFVAGVEKAGGALRQAEPGDRLEGGDLLMLVGRVDGIAGLAARGGLEPVEPGPEVLEGGGLELVEAVVSPSSPAVGRNIRETGFRGRYDAVVLAVHRHGRHLPGKIGDIVVQAGDTLLVAAGGDFLQRWRYARDFYLVSPVGEVGSPARRDWVPPALLLATIVAAATGLVPLLDAVVAGALAMVVSGRIRPSEIWPAIHLPTLAMIAASIALSHAVVDSGLAGTAVAAVLGEVRAVPPVLVVGLILGAAGLLTEVLDNAAAAALLFPVAVAAASSGGVSLHAAAVAVAVGAASSFVTPFGYHANIIVAGAGGYTLRDFVRFGLPLKILVLALAAVIIPLVW